MGIGAPFVLALASSTVALASGTVAPAARTFFAACPRGLEPTLARELSGAFVGGLNVELAKNGVWFDGTAKTGMAAVLWSRTANRVQELISSARASPTRDSQTGWFTKERVYDFARDSVDWQQYLSPEACGVSSIEGCTVACEATVGEVDRSISNSHYTALELKNAVVDDFRDRLGLRPSVDVSNPHLPLQLHVHQDSAWLFRTLSPFGSMHRRGYRQAMHVAVLRENLAAALILETGLGHGAAGVDPDSTVLCDPMCGSGTLAVEAALIATRTAPGLLRWGEAGERIARGAREADGGGYEAPRGAAASSAPPPFWYWPDYSRREWEALLLEAEAAVRPLRMRIDLNDAHAGALGLAQETFGRLGFGGSVSFSQADVSQYVPPTPPTLIVANPPWGRRIGGSAPARGGRAPSRALRGREGSGRPDESDDPFGMSDSLEALSDESELLGEGADEGDATAAWAGLGRFAKASSGADSEGLQLWALSGASDLTKHLRMKATLKLPISHGGVDLRWIRYDVLPPKREWLGTDGRRDFDGLASSARSPQAERASGAAL